MVRFDTSLILKLTALPIWELGLILMGLVVALTVIVYVLVCK